MDARYSLTYSPWMMSASQVTQAEKEIFERGLYSSTRLLFKLLRLHPTLSPHAIISPELGCLSAAELALLWIQRQTMVQSRRQDRFASQLSEERKLLRATRKKQLDKRIGKHKKIEFL